MFEKYILCTSKFNTEFDKKKSYKCVEYNSLDDIETAIQEFKLNNNYIVYPKHPTIYSKKSTPTSE